jgi:predicted 3-demethylubiquinone-9 3-methyltransferase (glyoxalase superfamily)
MLVELEPNGQRLMASNGRPHLKFSEAIPFLVECDGQEELDFYCES